ncbi:YjeF N-terminal domain-like protein [Xylariaceae sp. FL1272]|nr:YjeF N-terminal domain-like protein [Xylariaceae sp. FL1272]
MDSSPLSQWLGGPYQVVLRQPAGETITGLLMNLVPERHLTLEKASVRGTGETFAQIDILAANIADIIPLQTLDAVSPPNQSPAPAAAPPQNATQESFQDPAILSMGRKPKSLPSQPRPTTYEKGPSPIITNPADRLTYSSPDETDTTTATPLETALNQLGITSPSLQATVDTTEDDVQMLTPTATTMRSEIGQGERKRNKRGKRQQSTKAPQEEAQPSGARPGKGWRQTPILQSTKSFQPFNSLKKKQKGRSDPNTENGWASEDVTDVQEAGDFDFQGSLAKFDKRTIFNEMKEQDRIDDADRLVSHNRLPKPKPGTGGGKNYHYSENVLGENTPTISRTPKETPGDHWRSEADDEILNGAGEILSGREGSGRTSRLRGESRRSQSRKASASTGIGGAQARVNSGLKTSATSAAMEGLYTANNKRIETVTHLQMLVVENVASNELGLTEDLMAENAGRGICEVALRALGDPAIRLLAAATSPPSVATIVVLAGNNRPGARAIAAARHLRNRSINTLVCVVGIERERELLDEVRRQVRLFRNFGGTIYTKSELFEHLKQSTDSLSVSAQVSVTLIIDSLLGLTISFEELRKSDQASTYELMEWANRNDAFVMAIDVPSGIEPSSGKVNVIDGAKLYVHPRYVVALAAPKLGLVKALEKIDEPGDVLMADEWKIYLVDIGLGTSVWRKAATKVRRGIDFDDEVMELKYRRYLEDD